MAQGSMSRRTVLKLGATVAAATHLLPPRKSFAAREQKLIFWMQPLFNKDADEIMLGQVREYARQAGLKDNELQILTVPGGEVAKRMAAALEVGAPPDVTRFNEEDLARLISQKQLLPITDVVKDMGKVAGGVNANVLPIAEESGQYYGAPFGLNPQAGHARMDAFEKAGYTDFPDTWEKFIEAGQKITKPPFYAYGMALGLTPSDSLADVMSVVWPYGGALVDKESRPAFNSPGTVQAFRLIDDMYNKHKIIPRGTLSWDNSGNNKAYESGQVAYVLNPPSIYSSLLNNKSPFLEKTGLFPAPGGPAGRFKNGYTDYWAAFKLSPYPEIAKGLIRHLIEPKNYSKLIFGAGGRYLPVYPEMTKDPFWKSRPAFRGLIDIALGTITTYWPGKVNVALGEIVNQSIVVKWLQKVLVDRIDAAEAVGKCQEEMVAIYRRYGLPA
ncbi:MAG TPA: extracellular solute-binding protein [Methylomirabilota bacterium]|jgi:multiple sugar transport system substrate-binding protein|nr:extracellular solute-binding protein [Methylomirabilota bacterium]